MTQDSLYAKRWLMVGVGALALAGVLAIVLVIARTPQLAELTLFKDLFGKSLVIHVDLSVLVWFLAATGMLWHLIPDEQPRSWLCLRYMRAAALWVFPAGTVLMASSLLMGGTPLKNNYVPVLTNAGFVLSLGLVLAGICLAALETLGRVRLADFRKEHGALYFGIASNAVIVLSSLLCFYLSAKGIAGRVQGEEMYDIIFWGGGHVLQFAYVQGMMVAWVMLADALGFPRLPRTPLMIVFALGPVMALAAPIAYLLYDTTSFEYRNFFTEQMEHALGIAPGLLGLLMIGKSVKHLPSVAHENRAFASALLMSLVLFFFGGVFGLLIVSENVLVPAHYHGSIVGVTLALMGVAYLLLPRFGGAAVAHTRLAFWQPVLYGAGQLMHISGLAYSGGYEVLRKTPGAVTDGARAAMGIMGMGGLLAIIGGILFVLVVWRSLRTK